KAKTSALICSFLIIGQTRGTYDCSNAGLVRHERRRRTSPTSKQNAVPVMQTAEQSVVLENVKLTARRIFNLITTELAQVEAEFERQARSNVQVIAYLGDYLRESGGKRVRPALTILSNYSVGGDGSRYNSIRMATVMEFLHTATLVHDDIIDSADTRRSRPTVNALYGNETAVLMGDWLYMSAFETSLTERSLPILDILTRVTRKMTEGELLQLTTLGRTDLSEQQYLDIIQRKTAYLFSACCEVGAILGGASEQEQKALGDYGMNLGMAFQLTDDLLDFTSTSDALGKGTGVDLLGGKVTLPLIYLIRSESSARDMVQTVMSEQRYETVIRSRLLEAVDRVGAGEQARTQADEYAETARNALDELADSEYSESLRAIPTYVLNRDR
ncbi:MAG: polyprenyl synthetase family protein, partial [Acidobacteriota bacterium]|nr:polyprenyl synthetase family protein [Acidobacteriota bacterium]